MKKRISSVCVRRTFYAQTVLIQDVRVNRFDSCNGAPAKGRAFGQAIWTFLLIPPKNLCRIQLESRKITETGAKIKSLLTENKKIEYKKFVLRKLEFSLIQSWASSLRNR